VVNDLSVIDPGGEIFLNDLSLGNKAQSTLAVKEAKTEFADGSLIDIRQNWEGSFDVKYKESSTNKDKTVSYTPLSNLEINGHIENPVGQVNFFNISKDIVIQGKSAKDSSSIQAKSISISAPKGSIAQGYTEGITNIGYSPEYVLLDYYKKLEEQISKGITSDYSDTLGKTLTLGEMTNYEEKYKTSGKKVNDFSSGVWLAGGSIFLNGDDININGTIQSGYSQFEANLDAFSPIITAIQTIYKNKGTPEVTDSYLKQNCKLNQGGMQWDSKSGSYKYIVQAYYNPQTDKIVLEDVSPKGGKIYITGRISNTSNGKIFAADGSADINVINNTGKALVANTLDVGDIEGFIRIMDLGKNTDENGNKILGTLTEMTSKDTKVWYVTNQGQSENPNMLFGVSSEYYPKSGLTYNWSTGYQTVDEFYYSTVSGSEWWGLKDCGTLTWNTLNEKIKKNEITPKSIKNQPMLSGTYIGDYTDLGNDDYQLYFLNNVNSKEMVSYGSETEYGFLWFSKKTYSWAKLRQGSTEIFKHSIKADYPIKIGFLSGKGNINLNTNSDLQLNSDVTSKYGNVTLTSTNGSIEQTGGKIYADNIWLNATNGIGGNNAISQQMQSTKGVLSAITDNGDINILSSNKAGEKSSSLQLTATTDNGNVSVSADASLLNGSDTLSAKGSRIDLTSNYSSIGTSKSLLKIEAGQSIVNPGDTLSASVNATALKDVALQQTSGDMRLGRIVSKTGDVYLTIDGDLIDALPPSGVNQTNESAEELIEKWKSLGIISADGKDNSAEKKSEIINGYISNINTLFSRYQSLNEYYSSSAHKNETDTETYKEYNSLKEMFGSYTTADKWLEAQNKDKNSEYYKLQNEVSYGWTQDQLLYAIQKSIINKESGSTTSTKDASDANIKGRNIIINASGGIGKDEGFSVVDISDLQSAKGIDSLKAIAAAEASDVKWGFIGDNVDESKATINKVNGICIDASGYIQASAKGNIYLEDVNNNAINITQVDSKDGNIRIYGKNGIYNATEYSADTISNPINLAGKDLIIEGGSGSIGTSDIPVTTSMSGFVTAKSDKFINLFQLGSNVLTISAMYSGGN
ncbi:MAG: hypothetical protein IKP71_04110, partial [Candidatus Riflebacteria bacterium]|nr:hypothetical protein [Candidatus Riflebacteria bacterium]